ncbi:class I SAM-dependent methyltransferase [Candidatus Daviesbacteria bacterium]|nr:class I SAM-dependent methyltransferase [Candidatus Daviesbacteria bacterium]
MSNKLAVYDRNQHEQEFFDQLAKDNCEYWGCQTKAGCYRMEMRAQLAQRFLGLCPGMKILDLGCGLGAFTQYLLPYAATIYAIDISSATIAQVKMRISSLNVIFSVQDAHHLSFADNFFDAVVGNATLHHLDLSCALLEIQRVVKPHGQIFFTEPNMANPQNWLERHVRFIGKLMRNSPDETAFYRWQLKKKLKAAGFINVSAEPFDFIYPAIPEAWIGPVKKMSDFLEKIPLLREIAGSLLITGQKER